MKKILFIFLLLIVCNVSAQFQLEKEKGFKIGVYGNSLELASLYVGFNTSYQLKKHEFTLGFGYDFLYIHDSNLDEKQLYINYAFYPFSNRNRINFLLDIEVIFRDYYSSYARNINIGSGFLVNFSQHTYLKTNIGFGVLMDESGTIGTSLSFRLGLGYQF